MACARGTTPRARGAQAVHILFLSSRTRPSNRHTHTTPHAFPSKPCPTPPLSPLYVHVHPHTLPQSCLCCTRRQDLLRSSRNTLHNNMDDDDRVVEIWDRGDRKKILCDASVAALLGVTHADAAAMEQRCRVLIVFFFELAAWVRLNECRLVSMGGNPTPLTHQKRIVAVLASLWFEPAFGPDTRAMFPESTRAGKSDRAAAAAQQQQQEHGDGDGDGDGDDALPLPRLSGKEQGRVVHIALLAAAAINAVSDKGGAEHGAEHGDARHKHDTYPKKHQRSAEHHHKSTECSCQRGTRMERCLRKLFGAEKLAHHAAVAAAGSPRRGGGEKV